jgi:chemotaxis protein CheX
MLTEVSVDVLNQIVETVFSTMMDLEVVPGDSPHVAAPERMTSFVQMTGEDCNATVLVECSQRQACEFAGRILATDPPGDVDSDVCDMLGELANMIGGNLKSGLAAGVRLSMPTVMAGSDYDLKVCGSRVSERASFESALGTFWVTVLTKENAAAA